MGSNMSMCGFATHDIIFIPNGNTLLVQSNISVPRVPDPSARMMQCLVSKAPPMSPAFWTFDSVSCMVPSSKKYIMVTNRTRAFSMHCKSIVLVEIAIQIFPEGKMEFVMLISLRNKTCHA